MKTELKPCPFCSSSNLYVATIAAKPGTVTCMSCGASAPTVAAWNARAPEPNQKPCDCQTELSENEMKQSLMEAIARGWCHKENAKKKMDIDLANAILDEVLEALFARGSSIGSCLPFMWRRDGV